MGEGVSSVMSVPGFLRRRKVAVRSKGSAGVLEVTFSLGEVAAFLGITGTPLAELVKFGEDYGAALHPTRGGLWPTFKGAKFRRVPLGAVNRHLRHMARVNGTTEVQLRLVEGVWTVG